MFSNIIANIYKKTLYVRHDDDGSVFYFDACDFEGLHKDAFPLKNRRGEKLSGYFYYYDGYKEDSLVIFEHGMGIGHRAYMREIERIAKEGYLVYSYDHTGCSESGGEHIGGFAGSLSDLDAVVSALLNEERFKGKKISIIGHSWGGFSTMNIGAMHKELYALVAMSGFSSVERIQKQVFPKLLRPFTGGVYRLEAMNNPEYFDICAVDSLSNTDSKVLIIHSRDDKTVSFEKHFEYLREALSDKPNIRFLAVDGKDHNPNYTADAVEYKNEFFRELIRARKQKRLNTDEEKRFFKASFDFYRMTEQDEAVWCEIFKTLE